MELMAKYPDKHFDIAIVDPPYGIGKTWKKDKFSIFHNHNSSYKNNSIPNGIYFKELFRVSKHQIIWGWNYYTNYLPPSNHIIFWDKGKDAKKQFGSAGELAWTSITKYPLIKIDLIWNGCCICEPRWGFHPHEKPALLYRQLLQDFAIPGWKILDTHLGSGKIAAACYDMGFDLVGSEIDEDYFNAMMKRFNEHKSQLRLAL